ncbi:MAG: sugar nucleotide-binding protein [Chloroflexi bacterium]|nr:sugar nucleotide-binding protein [Chloroflexota bacterium]
MQRRRSNDVGNFVIVRTSLVYGFNPLDPRTAQTLNGEMPHLFSDEYRCPIFVSDLADAVIELAQNNFSGILHIAGAQKISRYDFGLLLARAFKAAPKFTPALSASIPRRARVIAR